MFSPPIQEVKVKVLYDFEGDGENGELSIGEGEWIEVLNKVGWLHAGGVMAGPRLGAN